MTAGGPNQATGAGGSVSIRKPWLGAAVFRSLIFFGFWLLLAGPRTFQAVGEAGVGAWPQLVGDLLVGVGSSAAAVWVSLLLLPASANPIHYGPLVRLGARFLWQSLVAGLDVARRVFDPRLPIKPGFIDFPARVPEGPGRAAFGAYTSLMPGSLPVGQGADGSLVYHCLDLDQPIADGLARDEALFSRIRGGKDHR